jgi:hypothetical protein
VAIVEALAARLAAAADRAAGPAAEVQVVHRDLGRE